MNVFRLPAAVVTCLALLGPAIAKAPEKDTNKDKIVGTWELVKAGSDLPKGATVTFTKDGKMTITFKVENETVTVKGTYQIDGEKLTIMHKDEGKEIKETMTIKTLTDKALVVVDEKKNTDEFKKK
jgi:uncharacterized protein (TIGR03066 family)